MNAKKLFLAGFLSFIFVNFIENLLYYSVGRSHLLGSLRFFLPSKRDLVFMITIMLLFATLQAIFTNIIETDILHNT